MISHNRCLNWIKEGGSVSLIILLTTLVLLCVAAMLYPGIVQELISAVCLTIQRPFLIIQNTLAAAVQRLREIAGSTFSSIGSPYRVVGAILFLLIFIVLAACGFILTLLTLAGLFGMTLSWSLPIGLELLSGIGFTIALAFLFSTFLEIIGLTHFGLWEVPSRLKPLLLAALGALIILSLFLFYWMGIARWHAMQINPQEVQEILQTSSREDHFEEVLIQQLNQTSEGEEAVHRRLFIGLPIFIDATSALAFCGAIPGFLALPACLLWLVAIVLQIVNIPFTILVQLIESAYGIFAAIINIFGNLGRQLGWQDEPEPSQEVGAQPPQPPPAQQEAALPLPQQEAELPPQQVPPEPSLPEPPPNFGGDNSLQTPHNGMDLPEPELMPIGSTSLDPLGIENNYGGAQR